MHIGASVRQVRYASVLGITTFLIFRLRFGGWNYESKTTARAQRTSDVGSIDDNCGRGGGVAKLRKTPSNSNTAGWLKSASVEILFAEWIMTNNDAVKAMKKAEAVHDELVKRGWTYTRDANARGKWVSPSDKQHQA